jgi:hypothetical protein
MTTTPGSAVVRVRDSGLAGEELDVDGGDLIILTALLLAGR